MSEEKDRVDGTADETKAETKKTASNAVISRLHARR